MKDLARGLILVGLVIGLAWLVGEDAASYIVIGLFALGACLP
jgi:hypothetical protein